MDDAMMVPVSNADCPLRLASLPLVGILQDSRHRLDISLLQNLLGGIESCLSFFIEVLTQVIVVNPANPMVVDLGVHLIASKDQRLERVNPVSMQRDLQ